MAFLGYSPQRFRLEKSLKWSHAWKTGKFLITKAAQVAAGKRILGDCCVIEKSLDETIGLQLVGELGDYVLHKTNRAQPVLTLQAKANS